MTEQDKELLNNKQTESNDPHRNKAKTHLNENRPKRVPLHKQNELSYENIPGFVTRVVNDTYGRIDKFKKAGWEHVLTSESDDLSDKGVQRDSQYGSAISRVVNYGEKSPSRLGYLMKIPVELYEEDQRDRQRQNDDIESKIDPHYNVGLVNTRPNIKNDLKKE